MTVETRSAITKAERVAYLVADPLTEGWIRKAAPEAESLYGLYAANKPRLETYELMISRILEFAREADTCAAFYGHPGVFVHPSHEAIRRAREEGIEARMLPGISAEDCLFADLGIDPAVAGCQSFEATDFLIRERRFDPSTHLVLWQVGVIGHLDYQPYQYDTSGISVLRDTLALSYPEEHEIVFYEASHSPVHEPRIHRFALQELAAVDVYPHTTLYVPPLASPPVRLHVAETLGIDLEEAKRQAQALTGR
jgi:uncharacterized protein YabN with tetrapyrrole methylase and pyrophosphatase domain